MAPFAITKTQQPMPWMKVQEWLYKACAEIRRSHAAVQSENFRVYMMVIADEVRRQQHLDIEDWLGNVSMQEAINAYIKDKSQRLKTAVSAYHGMDNIDKWWSEARYEVMEDTDEYIETSYATHLFLDDLKDYMRDNFHMEMREWIQTISPSDFAQMFWRSPKHDDYMREAYKMEVQPSTLEKYRFGSAV